MYTSLDWLNRIIRCKNIQVRRINRKITLGGFEVEETLKLILINKNETILDISATANRADSLSALKELLKKLQP